MRILYRYTGILRGVDLQHSPDGFAGFVLWDHTCIQQKAPVRLAAVGGLGEYVQALYGSRAEERCLMADWYYDEELILHRIEVQAEGELWPAKIIAQRGMTGDAVVFGEKGFISTIYPVPMSEKQYRAWEEFHTANARTTGWL